MFLNLLTPVTYKHDLPLPWPSNAPRFLLSWFRHRVSHTRHTFIFTLTVSVLRFIVGNLSSQFNLAAEQV